MSREASQVDLYVPSFVTVTYVGADTGGAPYTISNEATGKHFGANAATVSLIEGLRRTGDVGHAMNQAKLHPDQGKAVLAQMLRFGVVVDRGQTAEALRPQQPLEARAVMIRFDLIDASYLAYRLRRLGAFAFTRGAALIWLCLLIAAGLSVIQNQEKAALSLQSLFEANVLNIVLFAGVFLALKVVHEAGHALAYQEMCRRAGQDPGPIRMGISLFALTPFPFTDVSGAWRLKGRGTRALIGAGGLYFEFWVVAALTLFWAATSLGPLQQAIFQAAMFSALSSLFFNLNPAVKLDGYYIFSDLLGQPNLAGRASQAARALFTRALGGDAAAPERGPLAYWGISYLYRWTIFAGIFWLAYAVDPRLGPPVAIIVVLLLVVRPLAASFGQAKSRGARPMRLTLVLGGLVACGVLAAVPFPDRVLMDGALHVVETVFLRVDDPAKLRISENGHPELQSPELVFRAKDLELRRAMVETTLRAVSGSAAEKTRLETDLAQIKEMEREVAARLADLTDPIDATGAWTPLAAEKLDGAWVRPHGSEALGGLSRPIAPKVALWMEEADFAPGLLSQDVQQVEIRLLHNPECQFEATLATDVSALSLSQGALPLDAALPDGLPDCARALPHGTALVARLPAPPSSLFVRGWRLTTRLLQDRLPIERLTEDI